MHNAENWRILQETYKQVVGLEKSSIPPTFDRSVTGYQVPIKIDFAESVAEEENVERGVFAKELIPWGTLVWKSTMTASFDNGQDYRDFLKRLPPEFDCDVLAWGYIRSTSLRRRLLGLLTRRNPMTTKRKRQDVVICVDLDEGVYTNGGDADIQCNIGFADKFSARHASGCNMAFYANRDIAAWEEMRHNYASIETRNTTVGHPWDY
jgi:hypothetical protein